MKKIFLSLVLVNALSAGAQNVGIGVANPGRAKLQVHGVAGNGNTSAIFGGEGTGISFQKALPAIGYNQYRDATGSRYMADGFAAVQSLDPATGVMKIDFLGTGSANSLTTLPAPGLTFTSLGNVLIGGSSFNSSLGVARIPGLNATALLNGSTHASAFAYGSQEDTYIRAGKDGGTVIINDIPGGKIAIGGSVGINVANPTHPLEVKKSGDQHIVLVEPETFNNWEFNVHSSTGDLQMIFNGALKGKFVQASGDYQRVSDARLKKNIENLPATLQKTMKLKPVEYEVLLNNPQHRRTIGFIAQDVKEIFPELVTIKNTGTDDKGINDLHTLNYESFGVLAVKAIQEQQVLIEAQRASIEDLQRRINVLKKIMHRR